MKFSVLQENFAAALNTAKPGIMNRATLPVISNFLLEAEGDTLRVSSTNFEIGIICPVGAKVEEPGAITLPGKLLAELVASLPPERIDVVTDEETMAATLKCARVETRLNGISAEEFPGLAAPDGNGYPFDPAQFKRLVKQTTFAAARDEARPVFTGALLSVRDGVMSLVAADGFRLAVNSVNGQRPVEDKAMIVPARVLGEIGKIIDDDTESVTMFTIDDRTVIFDIDGVIVTSQVINGNFPDYTALVPTQHKTVCIVDYGQFRDAIKVAALFARDTADIVKFDMQPPADELASGTLSLSSESSEMGNAATSIDALIDGEPLLIAFNVKYIKEMVDRAECMQLMIKCGGSSSPGLIHPAHDESFSYVVMPMHIQERMHE